MLLYAMMSVDSFVCSRAILVDRFEQLLHSDFWGDDYWNVRKCKYTNIG